jgi:hypothetical protein
MVAPPNSRRGLSTEALFAIVLVILIVCGGVVCLFAGISALSITFAPTPTVTPSPTVTSTPTSSTAAQIEHTTIPERDLIALTMRLKKPKEPIKKVVNDTPPSFTVGDRFTFWVHDEEKKTNFQATADLRYITPHVYMWVQDGYDLKQEDIEAAANLFETKIYPTDREFFGSEWTPGVDNDVHLSVFNGEVPGVGGYFSSADEYSHKVNPYSNEKEMFYVNLESDRPGSDEYNSTLAHEFQHMIHWYNDRTEDTWVNEGMSELAQQLNGYLDNYAVREFTDQPDTQLTGWEDDIDLNGPHYGAAYLFAAYFLDRFGEEAMRQVVADKAHGMVGFQDVLTQRKMGLQIDDVFADWLIASYLDDSALADGRYGYRDLTLDPLPLAETIDRYPAKHSGTVHQYAADYIELVPQPGQSADLAIDFQGSTTVKLVPNNPHSGKFEWWSNRGDDSDSMLTHSFDLRGLTKATLTYWLWYDLEEDYDYAYVEISTDGGQTWDILHGKYGTDSNPNGNSLGFGYTGKSGVEHGNKEAPATWVQEKIDLMPYVGKQIQVRFEMVTDDAVNHPGLCVDDIAIPELNYRDDTESSDDGWQAAGFIRFDNVVPQRYIVQLITYGPTIKVERMTIDASDHGRLVLKGLGGEAKKAVLVVAALALSTTETADYKLSIAPAH